MSSVFVSYSHQDKEFARSISTYLAGKGFDVWWDFEIRGGQDYRRRIDQQLTEADFVVVLWSKASVDSHWVIEEADEGANQRKLIPILIEDVAIPRGFRAFQTLDLRDWDGEHDFPELDRLLRTLTDSGERPLPPIETNTPLQVPLRKAATRNTILILMAVAYNSSNTLWAFMFPETAKTEVLGSPWVTMLLLLLAAVSWFARTKLMASIALMISVLLANLTVLYSQYQLEPDVPAFGVDSAVCVLTLSFALVWAIGLGAIRFLEAFILSFLTSIIYAYTAFTFLDATPLLVFTTANLIWAIGFGSSVLKLKWIRKFYG